MKFLPKSRKTSFILGLCIVVGFYVAAGILIVLGAHEHSSRKGTAETRKYFAYGLGCCATAFTFLIFLLRQYQEILPV